MSWTSTWGSCPLSKMLSGGGKENHRAAFLSLVEGILQCKGSLILCIIIYHLLSPIYFKAFVIWVSSKNITKTRVKETLKQRPLQLMAGFELVELVERLRIEADDLTNISPCPSGAFQGFCELSVGKITSK